MTVILDAQRMKTKTETHEYLKEQLSFPDYYGKNLDALADCLGDLNDTEIRIQNTEDADGYTEKVLRVFRAVARENEDIAVIFE